MKKKDSDQFKPTLFINNEMGIVTIINIRQEIWETNSSSVHQVIIHTRNPQLTDKPELIVRRRDVSLHTYGDRTEKMSTAQEKLDFVVMCILTTCEDNADAIYAFLTLTQLLKDYGVEINIDISSFADTSLHAAIAYDVAKDIVELITAPDPDKIAAFIFDPNSNARGVHVDFVNEPGYLLRDSDPGYDDYDILIDEY